MFDNFFNRVSFLFALHVLICVFVGLNCFYLIENGKINKINRQLKDYSLSLEQSIVSLKSQNTLESLDLYKDKIIKKSSYKKIDEEVFDITEFDQNFSKISSTNQTQTQNYQKWLDCLTGNKTLSISNNSSFCR